jgi:hypothetical protein
MPEKMGGFERIAPGETYEKITKIVSLYRT